MTINSDQAYEIAKKHFKGDPEDEPIPAEREMVVDSEFEENEKYFAFFASTRKYLITGDVRDELVGGSPILISKSSGEIRHVGTFAPWEKILKMEEEGTGPFSS